MRSGRRGNLALLLLGLVAGGPAAGQGLEDALPADGLTGKQIYERVVANRFHSTIQDLVLRSSDRGGSEQETRTTVTWENHNQKDGSDGVHSKTKILYTYPFDIRFTSYLIIHKEAPPSDQFVYLPARRRVRRVNLRGENLFGTDFSFEDIVPREVAKATYQRLPDVEMQGVPVFVVDATPTPESESEYSRFVVYVEKEHYVPLEIHYWDTAGVAVKKLGAERESIQDIGGVWMPMRATMRHLLHESETRLSVERVVPNPPLDKGEFDVRRLEGH